MQFVFIYEPADATVRTSISEQPDHRAWIAKLRDDKTLIVAGPFTDDAGGMAIVEAASRDAAEALLKTDPAILNGTFKAAIRPIRLLHH